MKMHLRRFQDSALNRERVKNRVRGEFTYVPRNHGVTFVPNKNYITSWKDYNHRRVTGCSCFYTAIPCIVGERTGNLWADGFHASCEHLVSMHHLMTDAVKRGLTMREMSRADCPIVGSLAVVNKAMGTAPLMVKLTVRKWLETTNFNHHRSTR